MRKTTLVIILVMLLSVGTSVLAASYPYEFSVQNEDIGYNSVSQWKYPGFSHAGVTVQKITNNWSQWDKYRVTNFIIVQTNGIQVAYNVQVPINQTHYAQYYTSAHEGNVILRGNSTAATGVGYRVSGVWDPNVNP